IDGNASALRRRIEEAAAQLRCSNTAARSAAEDGGEKTDDGRGGPAREGLARSGSRSDHAAAARVRDRDFGATARTGGAGLRNRQPAARALADRAGDAAAGRERFRLGWFVQPGDRGNSAGESERLQPEPRYL